MKKVSLVVSVLALLALVGAGCSATQNTDTVSDVGGKQTRDTELELFSFDETEYDFGVIKQSGGKVKHDFAFTYNGTETVTITGVPTSCACTSATIDKTTLGPGDDGVVTVTFNPNLHAEPEGKFFKSVSLITEPKVDEMPEVKIWAEIDLDLGPEAFELKSDHVDEEGGEEEGLTSYTSITPEKLAKMLEDKDFTLIDVHIPEQDHIEGTDAFIPYTDIDHSSKLPKDKNAKIVLYCRSGGMSRAAAYTLAEEGYTNVYDLAGGKNAYDAYKQEQ